MKIMSSQQLVCVQNSKHNKLACQTVKSTVFDDIMNFTRKRI